IALRLRSVARAAAAAANTAGAAVRRAGVAAGATVRRIGRQRRAAVSALRLRAAARTGTGRLAPARRADGARWTLRAALAAVARILRPIDAARSASHQRRPAAGWWGLIRRRLIDAGGGHVDRNAAVGAERERVDFEIVTASGGETGHDEDRANGSHEFPLWS